jgi:hypothetical protein
MRVTFTTSPGGDGLEHFEKLAAVVVCARHFSRKILLQPAPRSCSSWASSVWP